jgi:hypothetical protein
VSVGGLETLSSPIRQRPLDLIPHPWQHAPPRCADEDERMVRRCTRTGCELAPRALFVDWASTLVSRWCEVTLSGRELLALALLAC